MNTIPSFFSKSWVLWALTLAALGVSWLAGKQLMSQSQRPAAPSASPAAVQETHALPDATTEADLPQAGIPVATTPKESSPVSPAPVSAPAQETVAVSMGSRQIIVPPLARAVKAASNVPSVGLGPSGNNSIPTVDPPLVFVVDPKNLTPVQRAAVAQIQDQFLKTIGDGNQDPADPAYVPRWKTAQAIADQSYRAFFGWQAFEQMQLERAMNSYTAIQGP